MHRTIQSYIISVVNHSGLDKVELFYCSPSKPFCSRLSSKRVLEALKVRHDNHDLTWAGSNF